MPISIFIILISCLMIYLLVNVGVWVFGVLCMLWLANDINKRIKKRKNKKKDRL